ncbi:MAG: biotin/lipoyl-containing protein [Desulfobacterales bacterium]
MIEDLKVPTIGENVESGSVVGVLVQVGDTVAVDDPIIELETDKAVVEIPASVAGKVTEVLVAVGDEVRVGDVIARVDTAGRAAEKDPDAQEADESAPDAESQDQAAQETGEKQKPAASPAQPSDATPAAGTDPHRPEARQPAAAAAPQKTDSAEAQRSPAPTTPAVRRLARELGVEIHAVKGNGPGGRISEADVKAHVKAGPRFESTADPVRPLPDFSRWEPLAGL